MSNRELTEAQQTVIDHVAILIQTFCVKLPADRFSPTGEFLLLTCDEVMEMTVAAYRMGQHFEGVERDISAIADLLNSPSVESAE